MRLLLTITILMLLTSCSAIDIERYSSNEPRLDFFNYFSGNTKGWGIVQDRKGVLIHQFVVDIKGELNEDGQLVLEEKFDWHWG